MVSKTVKERYESRGRTLNFMEDISHEFEEEWNSDAVSYNKTEECKFSIWTCLHEIT